MISKVCGGRPRPANDLVNQAIQNAPQIAGTMNYLQLTAQEYLQQHPQSTYSQYASNTPENIRLTLAEYNQIRTQNNLPPPQLGSAPMTYAEFQANNYPIHSFVEPLLSEYGSNSVIPVNVQQSAANIQTWLQNNPPPLQQNYIQWIDRFLRANEGQINNLPFGVSSNNNDMVTMMQNYINNNVQNINNTIWNDTRYIRNLFTSIYHGIHPDDYGNADTTGFLIADISDPGVR
jgi:hypothetical protein